MTENIEDHTEEISESRNTEDMRNVSHRNIAHTENPDIGKSENVGNQHSSRDRDESGGSAASDDTSDSSPNSDNGHESTNEEPVDNSEDAPDTFPREYVEKLRDENAKYRKRAQRSDELANRLHTALVEATGSLQDASDLPFDESHLDDPEALQQAIDELLAAKPHLAARRPRGDVGQGQTGTSNTVDLAEMLRARV